MDWTTELLDRLATQVPCGYHRGGPVSSEPTALAATAMHVLALKAAGHRDHPRTREAVRLLIDRLLPGGGCNYGNTIVLGQELRPQLQPTGLAMLALAGETDPDGRVAMSLAYLKSE